MVYSGTPLAVRSSYLILDRDGSIENCVLVVLHEQDGEGCDYELATFTLTISTVKSEGFQCSGI